MIDRLVEDAKTALIPIRRDLDQFKSVPFVTANARKAVELARFQANDRPESNFYSAHLLRGLILEKDGLASRLLNLSHVSAEEVKARLEEIESDGQAVCLTEEGGAIARFAAEAAVNAGAYSVGTEHLLSAILRVDELTAVKLLQDLSVDVDGLRQHLTAVASPPDGDIVLSPLVSLGKQKGFERYSDDLLRALRAAQEEASRLGRNVIDSHFLLFGLTQIRSGKAVALLRKAGISSFDWQFETEYLTGYGSDADLSVMRFSDSAQRVIKETVFTAARFSGQEMITPDILMLAVLSANGPAIDLLRSFNINVEQLRAASFISTGLRPESFGLFPLREKPVDQSSGLSDETIDEMLHKLNPRPALADRFDSGAIQAIRMATIAACSMGLSRIGTEHILLGISAEGSSLAAHALQQNLITTEAIREKIDAGFVAGAYTEAMILPFTVNAKRILIDAFGVARSFLSGVVSCNELLLAILGTPPLKVVDRDVPAIGAMVVLKELQIDCQLLRNLLFNKLASPVNLAFSTASPSVGQPDQSHNLLAHLGAHKEAVRTSDKKPSIAEGALPENKVPENAHSSILSDTAVRFSGYSSAALRVVMIASAEARKQSINLVGTEHILLGLMLEANCYASKLLQSELQIDSLKFSIETLMAKQEIDPEPVPYTLRARKVFDEARSGAVFLGDELVEPDHLLMAIASDSTSLAHILMQYHSVNVVSLRQKLLANKFAGRVEHAHEIFNKGPAAGSGTAIEFDQLYPLLAKRHSAELENIMETAYLLAHKRSAGLVEPAHLMAAILSNSKSLATHMLLANGVNAAVVYRIVIASLPTEVRSNVIFSENARDTLISAVVFARSEGAAFVQSIHLLKSLINSKEANVARWFKDEEIDMFRSTTGAEPGRSGTSKPRLDALAPDTDLPAKPLAISNAAEAAMAAAIVEAKRMGHNYVGTEHVLLGLLKVEGVASNVMRALPVVPHKVRLKVMQILGTDLIVKEILSDDDIAYNTQAERMLDLAWRFGCEDGCDELGTAHLLLGLIGGDGVGIQALQELQINTQSLARLVRERLAAGEKDHVD